MRDIGNLERREVDRHLNNRAENSHFRFPRRERAMLRFRRMSSLQKFSSRHASIQNQFNAERNLNLRSTFKRLRDEALYELRMLSTC
jgi:putative transposase